MISIRKATIEDLDSISELESICFPLEQSASRDRLKNRLDTFSKHFLLAEKDSILVGYIGGMVSNDKFIMDIMYENSSLHDENGQYQMVFSLVVRPEYRNNHIATSLMQKMIEISTKQNRVGISLTCLESMVQFYENMGFTNFGVSQSTHGDAVWYNMFKILNSSNIGDL